MWVKAMDGAGYNLAHAKRVYVKRTEGAYGICAEYPPPTGEAAIRGLGGSVKTNDVLLADGMVRATAKMELENILNGLSAVVLQYGSYGDGAGDD